jgi:hypothetical protein
MGQELFILCIQVYSFEMRWLALVAIISYLKKRMTMQEKRCLVKYRIK